MELACRVTAGAGTRRVLFRRGRPRRRPARSIATGSATHRSAFPIRPRASSRSARTARLRVIDPAAFAWTDASWRGVTLERQVLYEMHVGTFTGKERGCAAIEQLPALADLGITDDRDDAGRGVRGPPRVGLRRRRSVRAESSLRHARRPAPIRRSRASASVSASSSTSSTTISARTATTSVNSRQRYFSSRYDNEWGEAINFDDDAAAGARVRSSRMRRTGSTNFTWTACASTRRSRSSTPRRTHCWPRCRAPTRAAARGAVDHARRGERAAGRAACCGRRTGRLRLRRPVERRLSSRRDRRADRTARGVLHRLLRHAAGIRVAGEVGISLSGPALLLADAPGAARRRVGLAPSRFITFLENHDQVANAPSGRGERIHAPKQPGHVSRADGAVAAVPGHADVLPGPGVRGIVAVRVLCRSRGRARRGGARRASRVHEAVSQRVRRGLLATRCPIHTTRTRSAAASCVTKNANGTPPRSRCIAICCACGARIRVLSEVSGSRFDGAVLVGPRVRAALVCRAIRTRPMVGVSAWPTIAC